MSNPLHERMNLADWLKGLLGAEPKSKALVKRSAKTYVTANSDRAAVIAEAMAVYRRERDQMRAGLDRSLQALRDEAPKLLHDPEAMARLLTLHRAHLDLRRMMASDHKRFLVLSGMRELLGGPPSPKARLVASKGPRKPLK